MVIGGGAAGLTAAREAARRGAQTALVQHGPLGGECTFTGCVPSKTLLAAANRRDSFSAAMAAVRAAVERIAATEDDHVLDGEGVQVIHGIATLHRPTEVHVDGMALRSRRIILATGSRPAIPAIEGLDHIDVLTNETLFSLTSQPASLAVLGGGPVGVEMAQAFARLGTAVTVIETDSRLLPHEEPEASETVHDALTHDGATIHTAVDVKLVELVDHRGTARLHLTAGPTIHADRVLVATGRRPVTDGLQLAEVGVSLDEQGSIRTNDALATSVPGIWAIGDVTGRMPFTHAAAHMARVAVYNALTRQARLLPRRFDPTAIPQVTFTTPEVARVGITEAEAAQHRARVAYLPLTAVDRAITAGQTLGFVKLIAGPRRLLGRTGGGRLLGATIVAPTAGELIHEPALAIHTRMFTGRLAQATHAYPTWSSAIQQATAQFFITLDGRTARPATQSRRSWGRV